MAYIDKSSNVHWLTPPTERDEVILPILGRVDLDPCSHPASVIPAARKLCGTDSDEDDGMLATWDGRVFANVTYGDRWNEDKMGPRPARWRPMTQWIEKMVLSHRQMTLDGGSCTVLALLPGYTDRSWLYDLIVPSAAMLCYPRKRIRFLLPGEGEQKSPGNANMYALWTTETDVFERAVPIFRQRGLYFRGHGGPL